MEAQLRMLEDIKNQIEKGQINFKKSPKDRIREAYLETRLDMLENQFTKFTTKHEELITTCKREELSSSKYILDDVFENVSDIYFNYKVDLKNALSNFKSKNVNLFDTSSSCVKGMSMAKLPKITIPSFSGKYNEWSTFRDLFISLVHNNTSLDDVQRLHYLRSQLSGEAEQLIRHVPITQANYDKCWNMLTSRYNNKRFMANCILKRLLNQKDLSYESSSTLKELLDTTTDFLHELSSLRVDVDAWDIIIIYLISSKLDPESRKNWELQVSQSCDELPTFKMFQDFLETRFRALEFIDNKSFKSKINNPKVHVVSKTSCPHCSEDHFLFNCKKFCAEAVDQRRQIAKSLGLCFNCLRSNHIIINCRSSTRCRICNKRHHSLLHPPGEPTTGVSSSAHTNNHNNAPQVSNSTRNEAIQEPSIVTHFATDINTQVLLATAIIKAESRNFSYQPLRALLDQGSQASFISEAAVQLLQLKKKSTKTTIAGIGDGNNGTTSRHVVVIKIQSLHDPTFNLQIQAHVLSKVTSILPERKFTLLNWSDLSQMDLADPYFNTPNKIDILLGSEVYSRVLKEGLLKDPQGKAIAQDTHLGWIVSGQVNGGDGLQSYNNVVVSMHTQVEANEILRRFWEMETQSSVATHVLSPEEQACEEHFAATTRRDEEGRYIVKLPFKSCEPPRGTKEIAKKRFANLEKRLSKDTKLNDQYKSVINEYLTLGHMERISNDEEQNKVNAVYLPHHAVIREDKTTTKLRVVFDASSKGTNNVSLNETLMVGPQLQADLRHTVMRWRQHPVCLAADIVKMYRQVKVCSEHVDSQRILWRDDIHSDIQEFRLLRVTFGTSCAPYLAVKALQQVACDEGHAYPWAATRVKTDFFMDDLMTGCQSESDAIGIYHDMNGLLNKAGFTLQKWTSNREELLEKIKQDIGGNIEIKEDEITRVLGLTWNRASDDFYYSVHLPSDSESSSISIPITKRSVISDIARLYDPLGWVSPCIITAKAIIQRLWISGCDWDEELPLELLKEWQLYRKELQTLNKFRIPRWIQRSHDDRTVELHGFSDASSVAYAGVIYIRVIDSKGLTHSSLVTSKTKVAPIKQVSIPRLELSGAVLVTKLLLEVAEVLDIPRSNLHAWTDSTVVLAWLSDHPSRWKTFVANRTSEILCGLDSSQWHYVQSKDNPADSASRGISPNALLSNPQWQAGPAWLSKEVIDYSRPRSIMTKLEQKTLKAHVGKTEEGPTELMWARFSSISRLVRVLAWCRRFLRFREPRKDETKLPPYLTASERRETTESCLRQCQRTWFESDLKLIEAKKNCSKSSGLASLNPFLDDKQLLRVGGRIHNAPLSDDSKHPLILPSQSHLARLIVADAHERALHGGPQLTLNIIRTRYWIIRAKSLVKGHIHHCVPCIRHAAVVRNQQMGDLPDSRVTPSKPFLHSGVDYAGPIQIRTSKGRGHTSYKGYICLFVCMATRAVHIEAVSDLTSQGFLAAYKRFIARRGQCAQMWSDNGTNFVGASKELQIMFRDENAVLPREIAAALANAGTEWHFMPPHAPNFGGLWEAGIKSTKHHLKRVIGDTKLTFEELTTVLTQIEACLNSRPISQLSNDATDPSPLTPGHFLVGQPLVTSPDFNFEHASMSSLRRWQLTQKMMQQFWRRWSQEYLTSFFQRHKWSMKTRNVEVGDVVLVKEDHLPPAKWLYGRVIDSHPGKDGLVRVVTLQCKDSQIRRPTSKLCILPVRDDV